MTETICVCGAGTMGSGIAQVAATAGFNTILFDVNTVMLEKSKQVIENGLLNMVKKGRLFAEQKELTLNKITFANRIEDCIATVCIEAIVEQFDAKVNLFNKLATLNNANTIFASNTSSLSITQIAVKSKYPQKVAGMHFFNPAPLMKLVEVVKGNETSGDVIQRLCELAKQMGKTVVVCRDSPGFIVNRVARHFYLEPMRLVEDGLCTVEIIDKVMEGAGFKMGPFKLMDLIGLDINYDVSNIVWEALGKPERLTPASLQKRKVEARELGKKTGKGFYDYNT